MGYRTPNGSAVFSYARRANPSDKTAMARSLWKRRG
jgi:hypothetical protein